MASEDFIPVVDFKEVISAENLSACFEAQRELHNAFSKVGFVYITNHGIDPNLVDKVYSVAKEFFSKPVSIKKKCLFYHFKTNHTGYIPYGVERPLDGPGNPYELFEACDLGASNYPDEDVPDFRVLITQLFRAAVKLAFKILELMACALKMKDPLFFAKKYGSVGEGCEKNYSTLRCLHYHAFPRHFDFDAMRKTEDNHPVRLGEHVDYGTLTVLFPNPQKVDGLQVKKADGSWIDPPYIDGAVLVNLGEMMQIWTADKYIAVPHRVIIPKSARYLTRQTVAVFIHPDADTVIECIDGSNKYAPLTAKEHNTSKVEDTIKPEHYFTVEVPT